jgi:alkyl sulfatase BDS1-like metallo-beta-lactamase superfamily hydrolase
VKTISCAAVLAVLALCAPGRAQTPPAAETPSAETRAVQARTLAALPFADRQDFDFARRGYLGTLKDPKIRNAEGKVVFDLDAFDVFKGDPPATVNPSLWRQAQLLGIHGLFKVTDRIYQVRGFDIANATFVKGDRGWIVIDALGSLEVARAALELVNQTLGARPVTALIYTHSHSDHFGGAAAFVSLEDARSGRTPVIAPKGFLKAAVGENVIAGPAMQRRATYQFGVFLPTGPDGAVSSGIGQSIALGSSSLIPPNREIAETGERMVVDGVALAFQLTPGTEAPAEMNIDFPDFKVIDMAENANVTQHNVLTPRGAVVRDAHTWAEGLTVALDLYGDSEVLITSHGWPRFGRAVIQDFLAKHRDAYAYLHDQTVRLMNKGLNGDEIAARLALPPALEEVWYDRPYYGSLSFNSRAVYQFYMGWYDANPAHLAPRPPADTGRRYVAALGGAERVRRLAETAYEGGDYGWAAELLNREVMADPNDLAAKSLLARCYDQLGWASENALWRNMYLSGALELRNGPTPLPVNPAGQAATLSNLPTPMLFDLLAVRLDGEKAQGADLKLEFLFKDRKEATYVTVKNGVLIHRPIAQPGPVDAVLTVNRADFLKSVLTGAPLAAKVASGEAKVEGDPGALLKLLSYMDRGAPAFPIVSR